LIPVRHQLAFHQQYRTEFILHDAPHFRVVGLVLEFVNAIAVQIAHKLIVFYRCPASA
jgi:uncharacterized membrane protein YhfC